jgi:hypothetical protein
LPSVHLSRHKDTVPTEAEKQAEESSQQCSQPQTGCENDCEHGNTNVHGNLHTGASLSAVKIVRQDYPHENEGGDLLCDGSSACPVTINAGNATSGLPVVVDAGGGVNRCEIAKEASTTNIEEALNDATGQNQPEHS